MPLLSLALVLLFGVDVPHRDGWDSPGFALLRGLDGRLGAADFWAQHNEARPLVPRLIFHASARAFGWHPKLFMVMSWAALSGTWLLIWRARRPRLSTAKSLLVSAWLLSPIQFTNLLWGFQLIQILPIALTAAAALLVHDKDSWARSLACAALCAAASFSNSNGLLSWMVACPAAFAWLRRDKVHRARLAVFVGLAALTGVLYAIGYERPPHSPGLLSGLARPGAAGLTFLDGLGGALWSFSKEASLTPVVGLAVLILVLVIAARTLRREDRAAQGPWLAMLAFALGSLALMALGRSGIEGAPGRAGRYASLALWLPAACIALAPQSWGRLWPILLLLTLLCWGRGLDRLPRLRRARLQDQLTLRLSEQIPHNPLLGRLHQSAARLAEGCARLRSAGLLDDAPIGAWLRDAMRRPEDGARGEVELRALGPRRWRFEGWAALPDGRAADFVLITIDGVEPWTGLVLGRWFAGDKAPLGTGLKVSLQVFEELSVQRLKAFAIDAEARRAYPVVLHHKEG